jgi:hypothetical protein
MASWAASRGENVTVLLISALFVSRALLAFFLMRFIEDNNNPGDVKYMILEFAVVSGLASTGTAVAFLIWLPEQFVYLRQSKPAIKIARFFNYVFRRAAVASLILGMSVVLWFATLVPDLRIQLYIFSVLLYLRLNAP